MKQQFSPLEILEFVSLAGTAAGTISVVLLSQHVGYSIAPGAASLVLGAANRRRLGESQSNSTELVQANQKLSADLASVRQQLQGLPSSSDYNSLKSSVQENSNSLAGLESEPPGQLTNVGVELNPIRQDIVQLRSQYGNLQDFLAQLRDRIATLPPPDRLQTMDNELKQMEEKLAQLPSKFQKMTSEANATEINAVTAEVESLKVQLQSVADSNDLSSLAPELQVLKRRVEALENTSDRLVVETQNLAEKQETFPGALDQLQKQQQDWSLATAEDRTTLADLGDRIDALNQQLNRVTESTAEVDSTAIQQLQQRFQELKEKVDLHMAVAAVEVKDGQTIELTGVEDALFKIAGAVSEVKQEMDNRLESIESVELRTIHAQLLEQQQILTGLQTEYQQLLALTSEGSLDSLSDSEYRQKIDSLERALANTTESIDRIQSSLNPNNGNGSGDRELVAIEPDLSVLAPEIAQIGWLQNTVSQLAANLDNLERQIQFAVNDRSQTNADEFRQEIDALKQNLKAIDVPELKILTQELAQIGILHDTVYQLSGTVDTLDRQVCALVSGSPDSITGQLQQQMSDLTGLMVSDGVVGELTTAYEMVMQRLEQVEITQLELETFSLENQDLNSRSDREITDQLSSLNTQLDNLQLEMAAISQKLTDLESGAEDSSKEQLEMTRQDVVALQATVSDILIQLESDLDRTNVNAEIQDLAAALSTLETKLTTAIVQLDNEFNQLQLQTTQLATEQAQSAAATSQIETLIGNSIDRQMGAISQLLQDVAPCDYQLIFDRPAIQESLATAIDNSKKRLMIVCPWLNRETISGMLDKLEAFLQRNGRLQIGWGHLADINDGEFPLRINQKWETDPLAKRRQSYDALNDLEALREKYPDRVEYKILGTHENFLVSDRNLALISSHHFLSGNKDVPEREVAIETSSMKIIQGLIDRFTDPKLQPGNADAYYNRGFERLEIGDYLGAMSDYSRALEIEPHRTTIYNNLGLAKYNAGDVPGAIADYTKAIELEPDEPVTYFNRAVAYYKMGNYRQSIADYTQVIRRQDGIRISAESTGAYFQRAEAYRQLGEYDSAIYDYTMAIRLAPKDQVAYNNRGLARYNQGDYLGSINDYTEALDLNPEDAVAYSNRGVSRLKSGDYAGAVADFDSAIKLKANYASAYNNRGLARFEMGDRTGAISDLETAAELFAAIGNMTMNQQALDSIKRLVV